MLIQHCSWLSADTKSHDSNHPCGTFQTVVSIRIGLQGLFLCFLICILYMMERCISLEMSNTKPWYFLGSFVKAKWHNRAHWLWTIIEVQQPTFPKEVITSERVTAVICKKGPHINECSSPSLAVIAEMSAGSWLMNVHEWPITSTCYCLLIKVAWLGDLGLALLLQKVKYN